MPRAGLAADTPQPYYAVAERVKNTGASRTPGYASSSPAGKVEPASDVRTGLSVAPPP